MTVIDDKGLVLLGCGKMGSAMLEGWLGRGLKPKSAWVIEPHPSDWLKGQGVRLNEGLPPSPAIVLIAVKPQMIGEALPALKALGGGETLFVTVAAGTRIATYEEVLGAATPIVRAMPNTPAAIGRGITGAFIAGALSQTERDLVAMLLMTTGRLEWVGGEDLIDSVTAVSGSGPAYVFYLVETLAKAGEEVGLPADLAMRLARATIEGAGELLFQEAAIPPATLRQNVTSPGGTTAAALEHLMAEDGLQPLMTKAVKAARARAKALAG